MKAYQNTSINKYLEILQKQLDTLTCTNSQVHSHYLARYKFDRSPISVDNI